MNEIEWSKKAFKQLRKLPNQDGRKITNDVEGLKDFPTCPNVKKLTNHKYEYRLRVGRFRVLFDFEVEIKIIKIEEVKKRDENTY